MRLLKAVATLLCFGLIASCGTSTTGDPTELINNPDPNINLTGMPIVKEKITVTFMSGRPVITAEDWNDTTSMAKMEEITNIHVDWGLVPSKGVAEKRNLDLTSGDYAEVLYRTGLSSEDVAKYGEQGTFIALNELIDSYMPNLNALMEANPSIRKGITFPDGNIYSLPTIYDPEFESLRVPIRMWIRKDWLDKFGMTMPETLDDFRAYLEAVATQDPNGDGNSDEIPLADGGQTRHIAPTLWGTFDIGTKGSTAVNLDQDPTDGSVRFFPASDGYRDMVTYLNGLYADGLIQQDLFSIDSTKFKATCKTGVDGAVATISREAYCGEVGENYVALPPLKKTADSPMPSFNGVGAELADLGGFVMTDRVEHPIEIARWMDYFYSDEGIRLYFMGVEGVTWQQNGDEYEFVPDITDNPDGLTIDEALKPHVIYPGGGYPGVVKERYFKGTESSPQAREGGAVVAPFAIDDPWPVFTLSAKDASATLGARTDLTKLVRESQAKFINGSTPLTDWDTYISQLERAGLADYLAIQQQAYERFVA